MNPTPTPPPPPPHHYHQPASARPAASSAALAAALRDPSVRHVTLTRSLAISPEDFSRRELIRVARPVTVAAPCGSRAGSVILDMGGDVVMRVLVGTGGALRFVGPGLKLTNSPTAARHPIWPVRRGAAGRLGGRRFRRSRPAAGRARTPTVA
jgi:hypothetical protein